jgi:WD40 repeat protein
MRAGLAIAVRGDGLVADGRDVVMLRRVDDLARELGRVDPAVGPIRALAFSPANPRHLAVAGRNGAVLVDLAEMRVAQRFETPEAMQVAIAWNADGSRVHIAGWDRTLRAYRPDTATPLWTARGHRDMIWSIAWIDRETLATVGADGSLRLWSARDGAPVATVPASRDVLWKVVHDETRAELVLVARGRTSVLGLARLRAWVGTGPRDWRSAIAANGAIAEPRDDGTVWFRDSGDATTRVLRPEGAGHAERVALSRDASLLLALRSDGTLSLVDTARGDVRWTTRTLATEDLHESNGIPSLAVDAAGGLALVASRAHQCVAFSLETGKERWRAAFGAGCVAVAASSDGRRVFACDRDGLLASIDARDGRVLRTVRRQRTRIAALATADDDTRLLVACADGSLRILDAETLEEILFLGVAPVALRAVWVAGDGIHTVDDRGVERVR